MTKTIFSKFAFIFIIVSFDSWAEQGLRPVRHDLNYRTEYQGYASETYYEKTYKVNGSYGIRDQIETLYLVVTIENGPHAGVQIFHNAKSGKTIIRYFPDTYIEAKNGTVYNVYDYYSEIIYHNLNEECLIIQ